MLFIHPNTSSISLAFLLTHLISRRALWFGGLEARPFRTPQFVPHNFLDLSILLFVVSIASNVQRWFIARTAKLLPQAGRRELVFMWLR
jgi:hypothetical protein